MCYEYQKFINICIVTPKFNPVLSLMTSNHRKTTKQDEKSRFLKVGECLYRHKSSGVYYGWVKKAGKQIRRSLKTKDRLLTNRRLRDLRSKVGILDPGKSPRSVTFMDVAKRWMKTGEGRLKPSSHQRRRTCINQLKPFFEGFSFDQINKRVCENWESWRGNSISPSTFNYDRNTLISIFDYAIQDGLIMENPTKFIKSRKIRRKPITIPTKEQFKELIETIKNLDARARSAANLVELLAYSGMRLGEAIHLKWEEVDFVNNRFTITGGELGTKNHESRIIPLFPVMRDFLNRLKNEEGTIHQEERIIPISSAKKALISACRMAGLPNFHHHCMRHYFASNAIEKGINFQTVASWLGHKDGGLLVAKTYGHLRDDHSVKMARLMNF